MFSNLAAVLFRLRCSRCHWNGWLDRRRWHLWWALCLNFLRCFWRFYATGNFMIFPGQNLWFGKTLGKKIAGKYRENMDHRCRHLAFLIVRIRVNDHQCLWHCLGTSSHVLMCELVLVIREKLTPDPVPSCSNLFISPSFWVAPPGASLLAFQRCHQPCHRACPPWCKQTDATRNS